MGWVSRWVSGCRATCRRSQLSEGAFIVDTQLPIHIRKYRTPPLGVDFASAANALVAAHLAPVAPQGEIQTLGEHGLLWRRLGPTRAPRGALWHTHRTCEHEAYGSDLTPLVRLPYGRMAFEPPRFSSDPGHHPLPNLFCQQR